MTPIALATQTGGSAIRPASYCGVVGFKPSFGLIDRRGVMPLSPSLDTVAVIGRSVDWVARCTAAIVDRPLLSVAARSLRVGLYLGSEDELDPLVAAALQEAAASFLSAGATVRSIALQADDAYLRRDHATIAIWEARAALSCHLDDPASLRATTRRVFATQSPCPGEFAAAVERAAHARANLERWFDGADIILAPSVTGPAPRRGSSGDPSPCLLWTLLHLPCLTLPTGIRDEGGLPIGIQLIAHPNEDPLLIAAARLLESCIAARHSKATQR
ncbi:Asp-tRNA(Asn)/Glu-tRNA(Gln) amidotransferase A subunit family amidase [Sphingomonas sp. 1185]